MQAIGGVDLIDRVIGAIYRIHRSGDAGQHNGGFRCRKIVEVRRGIAAHAGTFSPGGAKCVDQRTGRSRAVKRVRRSAEHGRIVRRAHRRWRISAFGGVAAERGQLEGGQFVFASDPESAIGSGGEVTHCAEIFHTMRDVGDFHLIGNGAARESDAHQIIRAIADVIQ